MKRFKGGPGWVGRDGVVVRVGFFTVEFDFLGWFVGGGVGGWGNGETTTWVESVAESVVKRATQGVHCGKALSCINITCVTLTAHSYR